MQRQQHPNDVALFPQRRNKRASEAAAPSPRELTISFPTRIPALEANHWQPPREIVIGDLHKHGKDITETKKNNKKKPPKTIECKVKKASYDAPPPSIVVIKPASISNKNKKLPSTSHTNHPNNKKDRIPEIIQVQSLTSCSGRSTIRSEATTTAAASSHPSLAQASCNNPLVLPEDDDIDSTARVQPDTVVNPPDHTTANPQERKPTPDPPAAKADTTSTKIQKLPDFSAMARKNVAASPRRRRNVLDVSDANIHRHPHSNNKNGHNSSTDFGVGRGEGPMGATQMYMRNYQSWPAPSFVHTTTGNGSSSNHNSPAMQRRSNRAPQWMGVTGSAEDWIRATKPDDIFRVGQQIAQQRLEI